MSDLHPHSLIGELYVQVRVLAAEVEAGRTEIEQLRGRVAELQDAPKPKPRRST